MNPSRNLFLLIKSLSKSEKRHFKLSSSQQAGDKTYLKLFDALDKQENFDEVAIKKQFRREAFIKHFTSIKGYLYSQILHSMRAYRSEKPIETQLREALTDIKFLYDKGLFTQCDKIILKAKKIAVTHENYTCLIDLLFWELESMRVQGLIYISRRENIFNQLSEGVNHIETISKYHLQSIRIYDTVKQVGYTRNKKNYEVIIKQLDKPLFSKNKDKIPYQALYHYYNCRMGISNSLMENKKTFYYLNKLKQHIETHPQQMTENPKKYLNILSNYTIGQQGLNMFNAIPKTIEQMRQINTSDLNLKKEIFYKSNNKELSLFINTGEFSKGVQLISKVGTEMESYPNDYLKHHLNFTFAYVYFGACEYSKCKIYLNKLINESTPNVRNDIQCMARIISLIVHYETQNHELLEYVLKSVYRFLNKKENLYKFEISIINFFEKKIQAAVSMAEKAQAFNKLKKEINNILKDTSEGSFQNNFRKTNCK